MVFWTDVSCTPPNESLILRKLKLGFRVYRYIFSKNIRKCLKTQSISNILELKLFNIKKEYLIVKSPAQRPIFMPFFIGWGY